MTQINDLVALIKGNARLAAFIAIIVALVIVMVVFYSGSHSSAAEQAKVEKQLASARVNLTFAQDRYDVAKLQAEEAQLKSTDTPSFPASFPGVELSAYITTGASNYGISIVSLTPKGSVGTQTVGGTKYVEYDIVVNITASDYTAMDSFLSYLENGTFPSLSIKNASFSLSGGKFTGSFNVVILAKS